MYDGLEFKESSLDIEYKHRSFEIKKINEDEKKQVAEIEGIANQVGIVDYGYDVTVEGAFEDTVKENPTVPALAFHDSRRPVGLNKLSLANDGSLLTKMSINLEVQEGKELLSLIKQYQEAGRPMELSIGYRAKEYRFEDREDIGFVRVLEKVDVHEVSIVPFAMNSASVVTAVAKERERLQLEGKKKVEAENETLKTENARLKSQVDKLESEIKTIKLLGGIQ